MRKELKFKSQNSELKTNELQENLEFNNDINPLTYKNK